MPASAVIAILDSQPSWMSGDNLVIVTETLREKGRMTNAAIDSVLGAFTGRVWHDSSRIFRDCRAITECRRFLLREVTWNRTDATVHATWVGGPGGECAYSNTVALLVDTRPPTATVKTVLWTDYGHCGTD